MPEPGPVAFGSGLGGLASFSSFGLDIVALAQAGRFGQAALDTLRSLGRCVPGLLVGLELGPRIFLPTRN